MSLQIETERLVLRQILPGDLSDLLGFIAHPSVARVVREMGLTEPEVKAFIENQKSIPLFERDQCTNFAIERKADGKLLGLVTMVPRKHSKGELGYALNVNYRGQGYATEAARALVDYCFNTLGYHRIEAITSNVNTGSWKLMERLGMRREGQLRQAETRDNQWVDVLYYGILESEWPGS
jgi:RimJ/RimL family protein N-acetyltransferase